MNKKPGGQLKRPFYRKKGFWWPVGIVLGLLLVLLVAFRISPWPGVLVIRTVFKDDSVKVAQALEKHEPKVAISSLMDQQYREGDNDARLDVYFPEEITSTSTRLPVVVWTHGGAWISGSKSDAAQYFKLLAAEGYTVVAPNYTLAPSKTYPTPIHQLNDMHAYIVQNAGRFHIDTDNIILAGDSAGSQLSSQMAALITNVDYAREVGITPSFVPEQLKGLVLNCGIYKMEGLTHPAENLPKIVGWGEDVTMWAYTGTRDFSDPLIREMSPYYHVTEDYPPVYITGGNGDALTDAQSRPFADKLKSIGVEVASLFYPEDHQPALPHEYQFNLDNDDGKRAFTKTIEFVKAKTR